jgi:hypothetical protein
VLRLNSFGKQTKGTPGDVSIAFRERHPGGDASRTCLASVGRSEEFYGTPSASSARPSIAVM